MARAVARIPATSIILVAATGLNQATGRLFPPLGTNIATPPPKFPAEVNNRRIPALPVNPAHRAGDGGAGVTIIDRNTATHGVPPAVNDNLAAAAHLAGW